MAITFGTLMELVMDAETQRQELEAHLNELDIQRGMLSIQLDEIRAEADALKSALRRRYPEDAAAAMEAYGIASAEEVNLANYQLQIGPDGSVDWAAMPRTVAVESAVSFLTRNQHAASPADIEEFLHAYGREDSREDISTALSHLNRTNRVYAVGRAQWRPVEAD